MKTFNDTVTLAPLDVQSTPPIPLPLARRIVLHWTARLHITWFGFGILTAALVAGLQAMSVEISPIVKMKDAHSDAHNDCFSFQLFAF